MPSVNAQPARRGVSSTTVVLWLMILIVFLPIAAAHGLVRIWSGDGDQPAADTTTP